MLGHFGQNVFVSYSRQDFYVAEALTATLSAHHRAWLDVERIRPGTDWPTAIDEAIDAADVVVVVATPAAMASPHVTDEWRRALGAGKQVVVALVRRATLPPELANVPVYDLRGRFFPHARQLATDLVGGQIRTRARTGTRTAFPLSPAMASLWLLLLYCAFATARAIPLGLHLFQGLSDHRGKAVALAVVLMNAVLLGALIHVMYRLVRRTVTPSLLRNVFGTLPLAVLFDWIASVLDRSSTWWYVGTGLAAVVGFALVSFSRTVHLATPTGSGQERLRLRATGKPVARGWKAYLHKLAALRPLLPGAGSAATYDVAYLPQDKPIADLIVRCCDTAGFAKDHLDPRWVFFVVTSRTTEQHVAQVRAVYGDRVVHVLATSLRLPDDDLRREQWLDFREQNPEGFYEFLRAAVTPPTWERGVVTTPMGVDRFHAPAYVSRFLIYAYFLVAYTATYPIGLLLTGSVPVALLLVTALLGLVLVNQMVRTATRRITAVGWFGSSVLAYGLFIAWMVLAPAPNVLLFSRIIVGVIVLFSLFRPIGPLMQYWLPPDSGKLPDAIAPPVHTLSSPLPALVMAPAFMALVILTGG